MRHLMMTLAVIAATPAAAQTGIHPSDQTLSRGELEAALTGQVVGFYDDSSALYRADGTYQYRYAPTDPPHRGTYEVQDDSSVCVTFQNGASRCDTYVRDGDRLVLIIAEGHRFPVRSTEPAD